MPTAETPTPSLSLKLPPSPFIDPRTQKVISPDDVEVGSEVLIFWDTNGMRHGTRFYVHAIEGHGDTRHYSLATVPIMADLSASYQYIEPPKD